MRLKSLKLAGFKSFANPTTFTFKHDITAIVGPNGCGKSNIIDAVRWVLGETSAKQLRGAAMSDVIFAGADGRAGKSLASVDLTFEHTQDEKAGIRHALNLYHELTLRRQVTKEGKSDYFINGEKVRRRDVIDVFLGTGLGAKSYAVIEQGMIGRIVDSTPDELRAFIEEAAGVSRYQTRREETQKQLVQAQQNLDRLQDLQSELQKQHNALQAQAKTAKTYQTLNQQLDELLWQEGLKKIFDTWQMLEDKKLQQTTIQKNMTDSQKQITQLKQQIDDKTSQSSQLLAQKDNIKDAYHEANLKAQRVSHQHQEMTNIIDKNKLKINQIEKNQAETNRQISTYQENEKKYQQDLMEITPKIQVLSQKIQEIQQQFDDNKTSYHQKKSDVNQLFNKKQTLQNAKNIAENSQKKVIAQLDKWSKKQQNLHFEQQKHLKKYTDFDLSELDLLNELQEKLQKQLDELASNAVDKSFLQQQKHQQTQLQKEIYELEKQQILLQSEQTAIYQWMNGQKTNTNHANHASTKPLWATLKQTIVLTQKGEEYADMLDKCLQLWFNSVVCDDLAAAFQNWVSDTPDKNQPTLFLFKNQLVEIKNWQNTTDLVALDELIQAPKTHLFSHMFLLNNQHINVQHITQIYHHQLQQGMMIFTPSGWLLGNFGALHISHFQVMNDEFLSKQIHNRQRLTQINNQLDEVNQKITDKKSIFDNLTGELRVLEQQQHIYEHTTASTIKQLHLTKEKIATLTLQAQQKTLHEENFIKNKAILDDEKQELEKEQAYLVDELATLAKKLEDLTPKLGQAQHELKEFGNIDTKLTQMTTQMTSQLNQLTLNQNTCIQQQKHTQHLLELAKKSVKDNQNQQLVLLQEQQKNEENLPNIEAQILHMNQQIQTIKQQSDEVEQTLIELNQQILDNKTQLAHQQEIFALVRQDYTDINTQIAVTTSRLTDLVGQMQQKNAGFDLNKQLADFAKNPPNFVELDGKISTLKQKINKLGAVNLTALSQLQALDAEILPMQKQIDDVKQSMMTLKEAIAAIDKKTKSLFLQMLNAVNQRLNELFVKIFEGGQASLTLIDDETLPKADKWRAGLVLMAQPKGKKNARLAVLSGGEKTLTALSLVFAIFKQHPAPFCLLDEVDAPLDDANVGRFTSLIHELSADVQFIFISHNKLAMQAADELKGVTMPQAGISRLVTVNLQEAQQYLTA